jgi:GTP-binding protein HflX
VDDHIEAVNNVTKELGAFGKQTLVVFNKIDAVQNADIVDAYRKRFAHSVAISARSGEGVSSLVQALQEEVTSWHMNLRFHLPAAEAGLLAEIHRVGRVLELRYEGETAIVTAHVPPHLEQKLAPFAAK